MKNAILGIISGVVIILSLVVCLSLYGTASRQNEMENNLSDILKNTLCEYYIPEPFREEDPVYPSDQDVKAQIEEELKLRISSETDISVDVLACDFDKGILSVAVEGNYRSATGNEKKLCFKRTVLVNETE